MRPRAFGRRQRGRFCIYEGTVLWDGQLRRIPVHEAETTPLIGMSLLQGYELTVEVQYSGKVTVRALSQTKGG
jgi:hypothetical protein